MAYVFDDDSLRAALASFGVEDIKRWCRCGDPACDSYVLYGIGRGDLEGIEKFGDGPRAVRVLWVITSLAPMEQFPLLCAGIDCTETIDTLITQWFERGGPHSWLAILLDILCEDGLRNPLEAELRLMRAS